MSSRGVSWMSFPDKKIFSIEYFAESEMGKTHCVNTYPNVAICDTISQGDVWQVAEKFGNKMVMRAQTFDDIRRFVQYCIVNAKIESIGIDSGTDLVEMAETEWLKEKNRKAVFVPGEGAFQWSEVYEKIDDLIQKVKVANKYLIITSQMKDEWARTEDQSENVRTGNRIRDGYKKTPFGFSVRIQLGYGITDREGRTHFEERVFGRVIKNRFLPKRVQKPYVFDPTYRGLVEQGELFEVWCENHGESCDLLTCVICPKFKRKDIVAAARQYLISIGEIDEDMTDEA